MITGIDKSTYVVEVKKETLFSFLNENLKSRSVERFFWIPLYVGKQGNKDANYSVETGMEKFINDTLTIG